MIKFLKNQKGQAFSVFKILIAAIVALAILMLLLNIMGMINFNPSSKPDSAVKELVKTAYSSKYTLQSKDVTFTEKNNSIVPQQIIGGGVGLDITQIVFCQPVSGSLSSFTANPDSLMYTNTAAGDKEVTLYALCSTAGDIPEAYSNVFGSCGGGASDDVICYITVGPKK